MTTLPPGGEPVRGATIIASLDLDHPWTRPVRSKVPELSTQFWILTLLSTTVGAITAELVSADLGSGLGVGMSATTAITSLLVVISLLWQVSTAHYLPVSYWLTVISLSVLGTLSSDDLVDRLGLGPWGATGLFCVALAAAFASWYGTERTVSIHTVRTRRRELWHWLVVLCAFSLGASIDDVVSERVGLGFAAAGLVFVAALAVTAFAYVRLGLPGLVAFWTAYVLAAPTGAALGNFLTASPEAGGLGLEINVTSGVFLMAVVALLGLGARRSRRRGGRQSGAGQVDGPTVGP